MINSILVQKFSHGLWLLCRYAALIGYLSACTDTPGDDPRVFIATFKQQSMQSSPPALPMILPIEPVTYTLGHRDPFAAPQRATTAVASTKPKPVQRNFPPSVLEKYATATLRMVGTLTQADMHWGLIQSPDGIVHRVRVGDYVGLHQGRIQAIYPDKILLLEQSVSSSQQDEAVRRVVLSIASAS